MNILVFLLGWYPQGYISCTFSGLCILQLDLLIQSASKLCSNLIKGTPHTLFPGMTYSLKVQNTLNVPLKPPTPVTNKGTFILLLFLRVQALHISLVYNCLNCLINYWGKNRHKKEFNVCLIDRTKTNHYYAGLSHQCH